MEAGPSGPAFSHSKGAGFVGALHLLRFWAPLPREDHHAGRIRVAPMVNFGLTALIPLHRAHVISCGRAAGARNLLPDLHLEAPTTARSGDSIPNAGSTDALRPARCNHYSGSNTQAQPQSDWASAPAWVTSNTRRV